MREATLYRRHQNLTGDSVTLKKHLLLPAWLIFSLLTAPALVHAQIPLRIFESIGMTDKGRQLYPSASTDVMEDRFGRIWYATIGTGIIRYDGYNFKSYTFDLQDSTTLSSNRALRLLEDLNGDIWVSTMEGINRLDVRSGKFTRFRLPVSRERTSAMHQYSAEMILVGENKGLWDINPQTGHFSRWKQTGTTENTEQGALINAFLKDQSGTLWASSSDGLMRLHPETREYDLVSVRVPGIDKNQDCISMANGADNTMWVYSGAGLLKFKPDLQLFEKAVLPDTLDRFPVTDLLFTPDGALWLGGRTGVMRWIPGAAGAEIFSGGGHRSDVYPVGVSSMCSDHLGNLWMTVSVGLRRTEIYAPNFQLYQVEKGRDIERNRLTWTANDASGGMLLHSTEGMYYSTALGNKAVKIDPPKGKTPLFLSNSVTRTPDGRICVAWREGGADFWQPGTRTFIPFLRDTAFGGKTIEGQCYDTEDKNTLWIGTVRGLWMMNLATKQRQCFIPDPMVGKNSGVGKIVDNAHGGLWFDMVGGMGYFDKSAHTFSLLRHEDGAPQQSLSANEVLDITCTPEGDAWIATLGGVTRIRRLPGGHFDFHNLTPANGLRSNVAIAINYAADGRVWVLFNSSHIASIDPQSMRVANYDIMSPLQARPVLRKSIASDTEGRLYVCTTEGLVVFRPAAIVKDRTPPGIVLTGIAVNNKNLDLQPEYAHDLYLEPTENAITFEFAGIHTVAPYSNLYVYQLVGYDTAWVSSPSDLRRASYTNLPPGRYLFKVKAANLDEVWSEETVLLSFIIEPPYWQSSWFRFLVLIAISGGVYAILYYRLQQRRLEQEKELAEQNTRYKSQFLANMSHEIRTPMNAILGLSRLLDDASLTPKQQEYIGAIRHSSEDLLRIINDILDYSKIESGLFSFHVKPFNLHELFNRLEQTFYYPADEKGLAIRITGLDRIPVMVEGDPVRLTQILTNLVGNAIKFTQKGEISVLLNQESSGPESIRLHCHVRDTGVGIPAEKLHLVFESFSQAHADDAGGGGTGLGLTIAKQLVEQQGGEIHLTSQIDEGTTVEFTIPLQLYQAATDAAASTVKSTGNERPGLRILLVEDTPFNQLLAVELLKSKIKDVVIDIAENGRIALEKIVSQPYDLVLMDVKMPVMDGLEATRQIRAMDEQRLNNIAIIGLTANAVPAELEKCRAAGMNRWVTKPIQPDELMQAIRDVAG